MLRLEACRVATAVTRRALWESAVVSYGRMGVSDKRNVEYEELLHTAGGEEAKAFHASNGTGMPP